MDSAKNNFRMYGSSIASWKLGILFILFVFILIAFEAHFFPELKTRSFEAKLVALLWVTLFLIVFFYKRLIIVLNGIEVQSIFKKELIPFEKIEFVEFNRNAPGLRRPLWSRSATILIKEQGKPSKTLLFFGGVSDLFSCQKQLKDKNFLIKEK